MVYQRGLKVSQWGLRVSQWGLRVSQWGLRVSQRGLRISWRGHMGFEGMPEQSTAQTEGLRAGQRGPSTS